MSKKISVVVALLIVLSLMLGACAPAATEPTPVPQEPAPVEPAPVEPTDVPAPVEPTAEPAPVEEPTVAPAPVEETDVKVCQVTDAGGIDDRSFNETAWRGLQEAQDDFGVEAQYLESQQQTDYERNISEFLQADCDLIITVGFLLADATAASAEANPDQSFAIIDVDWLDFPNLLLLSYSTDQAAFMAGYMAAGMSQTGIVGTFGGIQLPSVTVFMDGFYYGVMHYNEVKGTDVQVLGWNPETQEGLFVGNFESTDDGRIQAESLMDEGADVILPVAGPVGLGTAAAVQERGNAWIIGVDSDWTMTASEYTDVTLTSIMKLMDASVYDATEQIVNGNFEGGLYVGTLENEGVGLGTTASAVPAELLAEVEALRDEIISGAVTTKPE